VLAGSMRDALQKKKSLMASLMLAFIKNASFAKG
jgi:hypothetical protein